MNILTENLLYFMHDVKVQLTTLINDDRVYLCVPVCLRQAILRHVVKMRQFFPPCYFMHLNLSACRITLSQTHSCTHDRHCQIIFDN